MATLVAPENFSAIQDAEALHKACEGWGTNEKAIISILGHRNAAQRLQIRICYQNIYNEDLIRRLDSELGGDFEKAVYKWTLDPAERDAVLANTALKKHNYNVILEIACVRSSEELLAVRRAYQARFKHSLEEDVAYHTSGDMRKLLVALVSAFRYTGDEVDARLAKCEADTLYDAIKNKYLNHEEVIRIVSTRSKIQFLATTNSFRDEHGTSITKKLLGDNKKEASDFAKALQTAIRCLIDSTKYYEKVLRNAIKKIGTDEDALARVIVTRAEKDMEDIKEHYYRRNSVTLENAVAKETSGDYKDFLLTLLGKQV